MHKTIILIILLLLSTQLASAATITGTIYDLYLEKVDNVIIEINTAPEQKVIAKDGRYSLNVPSGDYTIIANQYVDGILEATTSENITVTGDGEYSRDLIIFPYFGEDEYLMENLIIPDILDDDLIEEKDTVEDAGNGLYFLLLLLVTLLIFLAIMAIILLPKLNKKSNRDTLISVTSDLQKLIDIIKCNGGRITQKEIRKQIPLSEAKISLMISELEDKGIVKKIKKGRGNIIILTGR